MSVIELDKLGLVQVIGIGTKTTRTPEGRLYKFLRDQHGNMCKGTFHVLDENVKLSDVAAPYEGVTGQFAKNPNRRYRVWRLIDPTQNNAHVQGTFEYLEDEEIHVEQH